MKRFIVLYHMNASAMKKASKTKPEDRKKGMEAWMEWAKKCGKGLVDLGSPLGKGQKLSSGGSSPSRRNVAGYSILQAKSMAAAKKMLKGHPHLGWSGGCEIEIHETLPMPK